MTCKVETVPPLLLLDELALALLLAGLPLELDTLPLDTLLPLLPAGLDPPAPGPLPLELDTSAGTEPPLPVPPEPPVEKFTTEPPQPAANENEIDNPATRAKP